MTCKKLDFTAMTAPDKRDTTRTVRIWDFVTGAQLHSLTAHSNRVFRVQFDALRIISSSQDDTMIIWDFSGNVVKKHQAIASFDDETLSEQSITTV